MTKQFNLQDAFLNGARKSKTPVTIHVTNGYQIKNALDKIKSTHYLHKEILSNGQNGF